ncbi:DegT/DnrJ/EryC1/StrS family aminotransferase [Paenibacillus sp.]|uniref:DegT/DnrJ/EryC1/StrS family aminotransferase n=1 Tax=Paenibacillus sp. TaxID=58172 RepID=UPI002D5C4925|nr:DegT/DnrJ/EryC1/StrS family aminotransferase [Paenibacillus sp.]HZG57951.1 DegT/DnrJ/EryC1/StrS family aminotransferase [Paenibacillus sp.]
MKPLAIDGGPPARSKPLPPNYPGAVMFGREEAVAVTGVVAEQSPFRYYGCNPPHAVRALEDRMAAALGVPYVLGVSSCTAALIVALKALGIGYGDKVIVPANTFHATPGAVVCSHAVPVFADVDDTLNLDPNALEQLIDDEVKAIIVVPILGNPVDLDPILAIARRHGIPVIEDAAQSCGASYKGRPVGTAADIGVFSFQMNKIITSGEGGAIVTRDPALFERAVRYHDQGQFRESARYGMEADPAGAFVGQNYRMGELAGAVLLEQWDKLERIVESMRMNAKAIRSALTASIPELRFRREVDPKGSLGSALGMILPTAEDARRFVDALHAENIQVFLLYGGLPAYRVPQIFHQRTAEASGFPFNFPFKRPVVYTEDMCPSAVDLIARTVYLPVSPLLSPKDVEEIVEGIVKVHHFLSA